MIFVPRFLSRRRKRSNNNKKKKSPLTKNSKKRKVQGNYKIKRSKVVKKVVKDGTTYNNEKWIIYYLQGCPCCVEAKDLLKKLHKQVEYIEFERLLPEEKFKITKIIKEQNPKFEMTFPRIFKVVNQRYQFMGGNTDLQNLYRQGKII